MSIQISTRTGKDGKYYGTTVVKLGQNLMSFNKSTIGRNTKEEALQDARSLNLYKPKPKAPPSVQPLGKLKGMSNV